MSCVRRRAAVALGLLIIAGCSGGNALDTFPVRGEVTYNGQPLGEGTVVYLPAEPGGRQATGALQPDGTFSLTTRERDDGAVKGAYKIVIYAYEPHPGEPQSREEREAIAQAGGLKRGFIIPEKYADAATSDLTDMVDEKHSGFKKIELTD
jgi:hypothetical protein